MLLHYPLQTACTATIFDRSIVFASGRPYVPPSNPKNTSQHFKWQLDQFSHFAELSNSVMCNQHTHRQLYRPWFFELNKHNLFTHLQTDGSRYIYTDICSNSLHVCTKFLQKSMLLKLYCPICNCSHFHNTKYDEATQYRTMLPFQYKGIRGTT